MEFAKSEIKNDSHKKKELNLRWNLHSFFKFKRTYEHRYVGFDLK